MKAIVTGGCGFIGSHMVDLLLRHKYSVVVLDNFSTGRPQNLNHHKDNKDLKIIKMDVADSSEQMINHVEDANYIFHFAALADIVPSVKWPEKYFHASVVGTFNMMEAIKNSGNKEFKKLIYAASSSCYGIPDEFPTKEEAEIRPQYPYALTKRLGEEIVLHWGKLYKIPVNSLRFFNVYGPRSRTSGTYGAVFGVFLAQKLNNKPFTVVGDGRQTRDFTYVTDIVEAVWMVAKSQVANEIMNVGSGDTYSINLLVRHLGGEVTYIPKRPGEPDCTYANIQKIKTLLNWSPKISFADGIKEMVKNIDYWKEAPVWTPESIEQETRDWFNSLK